MDILPPDNDTFSTGGRKPVSNKQKEHLARARVAAKATIERRRKLEEDAALKEVVQVVPVDRPPSPSQDPDVGSEDEPEPPELTRQPARNSSKRVSRKTKTVELSEEEVEIRRFEKFMRNMNTYEALKVKHAEEQEEAKKVKLSISQDEYQHMLHLLEKDDLAEEAALEREANPVKEVKPVLRRANYSSNRNTVNRFGM